MNMSNESFILYVQSTCPGSRACQKLVQASAQLEAEVRIEDLGLLLREKQPLPPWLDGSPCLVNRRDRTVLYGSKARDALIELRGAPMAAFISSADGDQHENDGALDYELEEEGNATNLGDSALKEALAQRSRRTQELLGDAPSSTPSIQSV